MSSHLKILVADTVQQEVTDRIHLLASQMDMQFIHHHVTTLEASILLATESHYDLVLLSHPWVTTVELTQMQTLFEAIPIPVIVLLENPTVNQTVDLMTVGAQAVVDWQDTDQLLTHITRILKSRETDAHIATDPHIKELATYRRHLTAVLDTIQDALVSISLPDRKTIFVSHAFEAIFGYPYEYFKNDPNFFKQVVHPDDLQKVIGLQQQCLIEGQVEVDHRIILPNGQVRWLHRRAWINYDDNGQPVRVNDSARDITDRITYQQILHEREINLQTLFNTINDFLFILDMDGRIIEVNQPVLERLGYKAEELAGQSLLMVYPTDQQDKAQDAIAEMLAGTLDSCSIPLQTKSGNLIAVETRSTQGEWNGQPALFGTSKDISNLKLSELKFEAVFQTNPSIIGLSNIKTGTFVEVNDAFCEKLGFTREEVIGAKSADLLQLDPEWRAQTIKKLAENGILHDVETVILAKDGTPISVLMSAQAITVGGESYNFTSAVDITERKHTEEQLKRSENRYRQMFERVRLPKLIIDPHSARILGANPSAVAFYGYPLEKLKTMTMMQINIATREEILETMQQVIRGERHTCAFEQQLADGSLREVEGYTVVIEHEGKDALYCTYVDVTERSRALVMLESSNQQLEQRVQERTQELEEAKTRIEAIFNHSADGIVLLDAGLKIEQSNDAFNTMFAVPDDSRFKQTLDTFVIPEDRPRLEAQLSAVIEQQETRRIALQCQRMDGTIFDVELSIAPMNPSEQALENLVCIIRDVSEQKQAQKIVDEERNLLRTVIDAVPHYIYVKDTDHQIILNNKSHAEFTGQLVTNTSEKHSYLDVLPANIQDTVRDTEKEILKTGQALKNMETIVYKDGVPTWTSTTNVPLRNLDNEIIGLVGITSDISYLKEQEVIIQESEERYRMTIEAMSEGLVVQDENGVIQLCNEAAEQILGLTIDQMMGRSSVDPRWRAIHEDGSPFPGEDHPAMVTLRTGKPVSNVIMGVHKPDNTLTWIGINSRLIVSSKDGSRSVVATFIDITEQKKAREAIAEERNLLRTVIDAVPDFIYVKDLEHRIVLNNIAHAQARGFDTPEDAIGKTDFDFFPQELAQTFYQEETKVLQGESLIGHEQPSFSNAGGFEWAISHKVPLRNLKGEIVGMVGLTHDITTVKQNEEALQKSEERYRQLADSVSDVITRLTPDLIAIYESASLFNVLGYYPEELVGKPTQNHIHPDDLERVIQEAEKAKASSESRKIVLRFRHKQGHYIWLESSFRFLFENGQAVEIVAASRDVTERVEAEQQLKHLSQRLQLATEAGQIGIWDWNVATGEMLWDDQMFRLYGINHEQFTGKVDVWENSLHPEDISRANVELQAALQGEKPFDTMFRIVTPDGQTRYLRAHADVYFNTHGKPIRMIGVNIDITHQKMAEDALRESEEKFRMFIKSAPIATVISNLQGEIILVNKAAEELFNYDQDDLIGQSVEILIPDELRERHQKSMTTFVYSESGQRSEPMELSARHRDGHVFPADIQLSRVMIEPEPVIMAFITDITRRKEAEASLKRSLQKEKELGEMKSHFVTAASHQFRTPLAAILASTETLTLLRDRMDATQITTRLDRIRSQVNRMKELMDDVLELARMQSNQISYHSDLHDMDALCREVINDFAHQKQYQDRIVYQGTATPLMINIDPHLIHHVVNNLIHNALKYSQDPINVNLSQNDHEMIFEVNDQGIGIPEEHFKNLFVPFTRAENVVKIEGTGLGLSIVNQAVEAHGGSIDFQSTLGEGTTVIVKIPYLIEDTVDGENTGD